MNNLLNMFKSFFSMVDGKYVIATIGMIVIFLLIIYLSFLVIVSFQSRRDAVNIKLPDIEMKGKRLADNSKADSKREITIELIHPDEDVTHGDDVDVNNDSLFLTTLTMETRSYIHDEDKEVSDLKMPEVGEIDYDRIKEGKKQKKEEAQQKNIDRLREIALADNKEDLANSSKLSLEPREDLSSPEVNSEDSKEPEDYIDYEDIKLVEEELITHIQKNKDVKKGSDDSNNKTN